MSRDCTNTNRISYQAPICFRCGRDECSCTRRGDYLRRAAPLAAAAGLLMPRWLGWLALLGSTRSKRRALPGSHRCCLLPPRQV
jgi:hypothetical protein